ncbi:MAG: hypothetical protein A2512_09845 [Deltaproteobacteria bacterium RIFOXYD12_FULL_56_24]|nr:MAG: hypothetical protein A2512_09845 [Deltaproteobacteria bacterium RIFOXYD12_FULL_56_24]
MRKIAILLRFVMCAAVSLTVLCGIARQAQAAMPKLELTGTIERKIRSAELPQPFYAEPGKQATRTDRATAVIVDGNRMFVLAETIVKKLGKTDPKNDGIVVDFEELAVPCQARIVYQQLPNGNRNVLEIHLLSESAGATKKWAVPAPQ